MLFDETQEERAKRLRRFEAVIDNLERMCTNRTHAYNMWNFLNMDGPVRQALLQAWGYDVDEWGLEADPDQ